MSAPLPQLVYFSSFFPRQWKVFAKQTFFTFAKLEFKFSKKEKEYYY